MLGVSSAHSGAVAQGTFGSLPALQKNGGSHHHKEHHHPHQQQQHQQLMPVNEQTKAKNLSLNWLRQVGFA
jgi:hypothetical protein